MVFADGWVGSRGVGVEDTNPPVKPTSDHHSDDKSKHASLSLSLSLALALSAHNYI